MAFLGTILALLFIAALVATLAGLINPKWLKNPRNSGQHFTRKQILGYGLAISLLMLVLLCVVAVNDKVKVTTAINDPKPAITNDKADAEAVRLQQLSDRQAELAEEDRPHVAIPEVDYAMPVNKVALDGDAAIIRATGLPVVETEKVTNENGEPAINYYFSKSIATGLQLQLSREFIDVMWQFDSKDTAQSTEVFKQGERITRALLGGKDGIELYEKISKGLKLDEVMLDDGTVIKNARCGQSTCRYRVVR